MNEALGHSNLGLWLLGGVGLLLPLALIAGASAHTRGDRRGRTRAFAFSAVLFVLGFFAVSSLASQPVNTDDDAIGRTLVDGVLGRGASAFVDDLDRDLRERHLRVRSLDPQSLAQYAWDEGLLYVAGDGSPSRVPARFALPLVTRSRVDWYSPTAEGTTPIFLERRACAGDAGSIEAWLAALRDQESLSLTSSSPISRCPELCRSIRRRREPSIAGFGDYVRRVCDPHAYFTATAVVSASARPPGAEARLRVLGYDPDLLCPPGISLSSPASLASVLSHCEIATEARGEVAALDRMFGVDARFDEVAVEVEELSDPDVLTARRTTAYAGGREFTATTRWDADLRPGVAIFNSVSRQLGIDERYLLIVDDEILYAVRGTRAQLDALRGTNELDTIDSNADYALAVPLPGTSTGP